MLLIVSLWSFALHADTRFTKRFAKNGDHPTIKTHELTDLNPLTCLSFSPAKIDGTDKTLRRSTTRRYVRLAIARRREIKIYALPASAMQIYREPNLISGNRVNTRALDIEAVKAGARFARDYT